MPFLKQLHLPCGFIYRRLCFTNEGVTRWNSPVVSIAEVSQLMRLGHCGFRFVKLFAFVKKAMCKFFRTVANQCTCWTIQDIEMRLVSCCIFFSGVSKIFSTLLCDRFVCLSLFRALLLVSNGIVIFERCIRWQHCKNASIYLPCSVLPIAVLTIYSVKLRSPGRCNLSHVAAWEGLVSSRVRTHPKTH